ncbi:MAG: ornithine carbamoyltransferase [Dehalococcoidales bacterium]|nr:ornithine carbamoyltransferase [Dehalococcoidales bacterium]
MDYIKWEDILQGKDLLSVSDLSSEDVHSLIHDAIDMKNRGRLTSLNGKTLALVFEKPSLRTRVSFEMAMRQLGGDAIYLSPAEVGMGKRESVADVARVLSRYVDVITARTYTHRTLEVMASCADVPVINALSDLEHPCQALTDLLTIYEKKGALGCLTLVFVGDGNNVSQSLMLAAAMVGMNFRIASPPGYRINEDILYLAQGYALDSGAEVLCIEEPQQAVSGADIVYTDVWTSMGQENEADERRKAFSGYQIDDKLLSLAKEDAIFMHPLPLHRDEEVSASIPDSPRSVIFDQAENRMHMQKALLAMMLGAQEIPLPG